MARTYYYGPAHRTIIFRWWVYFAGFKPNSVSVVYIRLGRGGLITNFLTSALFTKSSNRLWQSWVFIIDQKPQHVKNCFRTGIKVSTFAQAFACMLIRYSAYFSPSLKPVYRLITSLKRSIIITHSLRRNHNTKNFVSSDFTTYPPLRKLSGHEWEKSDHVSWWHCTRYSKAWEKG